MIVETDWLADLLCADCGAPVMTISPGCKEAAAIDLFVVQRGVPIRGWCMSCAQRREWLGKVPA